MSQLLRVERLTKSFSAPDGTTQRILDIAEFAMDAGEHVALEGESGSGKTTLLHIIAGIVRPDGGTAVVDGTEVSSLPEPVRDAFRAKTIGYVFQSFNLMQGFTALENVELAMRFGAGVDRAFATALLSRVGLGDRLNHLPRQLSIGQQQRVAVARALANRPKLVLADEPTGSLDAKRGGEALALIVELCREAGASLLLVSHDRGVLGSFARVEKLSELNRAMADAR